MSIRTLIEINHDYVEDLLSNPESLRKLRLALSMGCGPHYPLPTGVTWLGQRHHSDPPFQSYDVQRERERAMERLRAGKRAVTTKQGNGGFSVSKED